MFATLCFYSSLVACIVLGRNYKNIEDPDVKKNYGTGLGIMIACVLCGRYVFHTVLMLWGNIVIIKCCERRYAHIISLSYTWMYLLYLHCNLGDKLYMIWIHQVISLRLVGLAFELYATDKAKTESKPTSTSRSSVGELDGLREEPTSVDIIGYAFFFIGLHKDPYYRWTIYNDHFKNSSISASDFRTETEYNIKKACFCIAGYFVLRLRYSPAIYSDPKFYNDYPADFRFLYNIPQLLMYILEYQIVSTLCASVATEAGFGVYPTKCQPLPGYGPTAHFNVLKMLPDSPDLSTQAYDFNMLKCYDEERLFFGPRMKDTMRSWDMPTRYWFWSNIYKNLLKANREVRSALSFFIWNLWSGPFLSQFLVSSTLWIYVHLESEYSELYDTAGAMKMPWDIGFSIMRMFCLIYLTPCLMLNDFHTLLRYYTSIFWAYHIVLLALMAGAVIIHKGRSQ